MHPHTNGCQLWAIKGGFRDLPSVSGLAVYAVFGLWAMTYHVSCTGASVLRAGIRDEARMRQNQKLKMNWIKKNWKMVVTTGVVAIVFVMAYNKFVAAPLSAKVGKDLSA